MLNRNKKNDNYPNHWYVDGNFYIVGNVDLTDKTFTFDAVSKKSDFTYNSLNLGISISDNEKIFVNMMGGYSPSNPRNIISFMNKKKVEIPWSQRLNYDLKSLSKSKMVSVKISDTVTKYFLSAYDAIEFLKDFLKSDMKVWVRGNLNYQIYKGDLKINREITAIGIAQEENKNRSEFTQEIVFTHDCIDDRRVQEDKVYDFFGHVLQYDSKKKCDDAIPVNFVIRADDDSLSNFVKYFKTLKRDTIYSAVLNGRMFQGFIKEENTREKIKETLSEDFALIMDNLKIDKSGSHIINGQSFERYEIERVVVKEVDDEYVPQIFFNLFEEDELWVTVEPDEEAQKVETESTTFENIHKMLLNQ